MHMLHIVFLARVYFLVGNLSKLDITLINKQLESLLKICSYVSKRLI